MSLTATAVFALAPQEVEMLQNNCSKTNLLDTLPKDLYEQLHFELRPPNEQEVVEEAVRCLLDRRNHRLPLSCIAPKDSRSANQLKMLDSDNDGYLSYDELLQGVEALLRHKMRVRQLAWLFVILFVFSLTMLGGIYGLVFAVVDMSKDTQAANAVLMSRSNGAPIQVASTDYFIQDGTLTVRKFDNPAMAASINTETLSSPPKVRSSAMQSVSGDDVDNTVKTSQALFTYDQISTALSNDAISKISQLTITAGPDPMAPFIHLKIDSIMRIPNVAGYGDGSILLIFSSAGRFVVNGTKVIPADGDLATKNITELHSMAILKPLDIFNRRRGLTVNANPHCNHANQCISAPGGRRGRRDETDCCIGQIYTCSFPQSPQSPYCPQGSWCVSSGNGDVVTTECSDLIISTDASIWRRSVFGREIAGTYQIYANGWNGRPVYFNEDLGLALIYSKRISDGPFLTGWMISDSNKTNVAEKKRKANLGENIGGIPGTLFNTGPDPTAGLRPGISVTLTNSTVMGVHCPGSQATIRVDDSSAYYFSPPYLRMCAQGHYCPDSVTQLRCDDITFFGRLPIAGTYVLNVSKVLNGYPIYVNSAAGLFIGFHPQGLWGIAKIASLDSSAFKKAFQGILWQSPDTDPKVGTPDKDPKVGWPNYRVKYAGNSELYQCKWGSSMPTAYVGDDDVRDAKNSLGRFSRR